MAQKLNPYSSAPFLDANGNPYAAAQLFVYVAGSSTKQTTTKDLAGSSAHTNPIILNASGVIADGSGVAQEMWQPEGVTVKLVLAPSTDTDPPVAAIRTFDNLSGVNDSSVTASEWISAQTPTFVSTTTFTAAGDHTTDYHFGRRIKGTETAGTVYGTIVSSAYTSLTTVTVAIDGAGVLDSGLSQVDLGLLTATNEAQPNTTSLMQRWAKGADIASATALTLGNDGNFFDVTGTTDITSVVTTGKVGTQVKLQFDGVLTFTHDATNLVLPGGVNITTAAGDIAVLTEYASGDFICEYTPIDGRAIVDITLGTPVASTSGTSIDFTSIPAGTKRITVMLAEVSTNGTSDMIVQLGDAGGVEATGYRTATIRATGAAATAANFTTGFAIVDTPAAAGTYSGQLILSLEDSSDFTWAGSGAVARTDTTGSNVAAGRKTLSAELDRVRITTAGGTNTFDAGEINLSYE